MRVLLSTYGSRGDVQPLVALAVQLQAMGAEARVCAPPDEDFAELMARVGVTLVPAGPSVRDMVRQVLVEGAPPDVPRRAANLMADQFDRLPAAAEGCDAVVATGLFPVAASAQSVAERLGVPYVYAGYCPAFLPSPHHRSLGLPGRPMPPDVTDFQTLDDLDRQNYNEVFGEALNAQRAAIGLPRVEHVRDQVFTDQPWLAADPTLAPWRETTERRVTQTGAWLLPDERPLSVELEAFLDAGPPPVYVGFGSIPLRGAPEIARIVIEAVRAQGRRVIVSRGWADLGVIDDADDCYSVGEVNQQALFGRVAAVVHHGGAGTTTAAALAGAPQVVAPQIGDQPYWAGRVADLGLGAAHAAGQPLTFGSLSAALNVALAPATRNRATAVASMIRTDGAAVAARLLLDAIS